ncbi:Mce-associated membrane protein [Actinokineospora alba]|uniref:Mce-associated membrane protein n=1 Tax=Actinokineospora alba TaxID=504798 RepID=A0A1H0NJ93_9PSEU|nr:hypothetical protein [Actinokineospora alba]TDP68730.1 Mce-associated membrane protein [Actinokineospora alba]SDH85401.1 Mce-associated membrane protein [Actinokineospora alba]SDO92420.1 Mce-associated membrane protein [Actinokineospora alba]
MVTGDGWAHRAVLLTAVLAVVAAAWCGVSWWRAAHDDGRELGALRDEARAAGAQALVDVNTLDHREVEAALDRWRDAATGELRERFETNRESDARAATAAKTATTATVVDSVVTKVDERAGTAELMAVLDLALRTDNGEPQARRSRVIAELTRTADGWKLSAVQVLAKAG